MFSFAKIATLAAFAFGTLVAAVPLAAPGAAGIADVEKRADSVDSLLSALNSQLQPIVSQLTGLTSQTATSDAITPIINDITSVIQSTVDQLNVLPAGTDSSNALSELTSILTTVLSPANSVAGLGSGLIPLFSPLGGILAALVSIVLGLLGGLLPTLIFTLLGLLGPLLSIIVSLQLTALLNILII